MRLNALPDDVDDPVDDAVVVVPPPPLEQAASASAPAPAAMKERRLIGSTTRRTYPPSDGRPQSPARPGLARRRTGGRGRRRRCVVARGPARPVGRPRAEGRLQPARPVRLLHRA